MIKNCVICNSEFNSIKTTKTCSTKCADTLAKQTYNKKYQRYLEKSKELGMSVSEYKAYIKVNRNKDTCIICGKSFNRHGTTKTCSIECREILTYNNKILRKEVDNDNKIILRKNRSEELQLPQFIIEEYGYNFIKENPLVLECLIIQQQISGKTFLTDETKKIRNIN